MALMKQIATATMDAASNTSLTSAFFVPGEFQQFLLRLPPCANWSATASCGINILGSPTQGGAFYQVGYSNNPATVSSAWSPWSAAGSATVSGCNIICEALAFLPGVVDSSQSQAAGAWAKVQFLQTVTMATDIAIYGRKF